MANDGGHVSQNKEQEAKEELKRRAKQLDMQRREAARRGPTDIYAGAGNMVSTCSQVARSGPDHPSSLSPATSERISRRPSFPRPARTLTLRAHCALFCAQEMKPNAGIYGQYRSHSPAPKPFKTKGMQLGGSKGGKSGRQQSGLLDALVRSIFAVADGPPLTCKGRGTNTAS